MLAIAVLGLVAANPIVNIAARHAGRRLALRTDELTAEHVHHGLTWTVMEWVTYDLRTRVNGRPQVVKRPLIVVTARAADAPPLPLAPLARTSRGSEPAAVSASAAAALPVAAIALPVATAVGQGHDVDSIPIAAEVPA